MCQKYINFIPLIVPQTDHLQLWLVHQGSLICHLPYNGEGQTQVFAALVS